MTDTHSFDNAIHLEEVDTHLRRGRTQAEWANMVGPFGGITAAALLHAFESHADHIGDPLALTVNFAAVIIDGDFDISLHAQRTNRTNQHWVAELSQNGEIKTTASAVFGIRRDSWGDTETHPPAVPAPEDPTLRRPGALVTWEQLYDRRIVEGANPAGENCQPSSSSTTTLWVRDRAQRPIDYPALAALCDIFYPRVFLRRGRFVPSGTVSMTTYFHAGRQQLDGLGADFVLASAHANRFSKGYFDQSGRVWTRAGDLLATTHQIVYFKG